MKSPCNSYERAARPQQSRARSDLICNLTDAEQQQRIWLARCQQHRNRHCVPHKAWPQSHMARAATQRTACTCSPTWQLLHEARVRNALYGRRS